ncbi:hypothetical protein Tco_0343142 [Tanacetum coccineum]
MQTRLRRASDSAQDPPPPPPSSTTNQGDQSQSSAAPGLSKTTASTEYTAWTTTTSRLKPAASSVPEDVLMHEESDFEAQDMGSDDEDSGSKHIPKVSLNHEWFKPLSKKERHATPELAWSIPSSSLPVPNNNWASALASSFMEEYHKLLTNQVDEGLLRYNVSRPLPLGGPPGQVMIQTSLHPQTWSIYDLAKVSLLVVKRPNFTSSDTQMPPTKRYCRLTWILKLFGGIEVLFTLRGLTLKTWYLAKSSRFLNTYAKDKKASLTAITIWIRNLVIENWVMIMRFNEIHKFSDGTLQFWTTNDVIKSKQFMFAIQKRLKLRQIFQNLESFIDLKSLTIILVVWYCQRTSQASVVIQDGLYIYDRLVLENIGSRRFHLVNLLIIGSRKDGDEIPRSSGVNSQPHAHT